MRIGYACVTVGAPNMTIRGCIKKNADESRLLAISLENLNTLERIIEYNIENEILLYRISSDLIPFGSSEVNQTDWVNLFSEDMDRIGQKIKKSGMRVSMHPGQYTVLNSPTTEVRERAIMDLRYHQEVLKGLGLGNEHKIILHVGGKYDCKESSLQRFRDTFNSLENEIQNRLVLENDEKSFSIEEVLGLCDELSIPAVYDNLHDLSNPGRESFPPAQWIKKCKKTWKEEDGPQKIHYSEQDPTKRQGAHATTIDVKRFKEFIETLEDEKLDVMIEVKDKNLSALKCSTAVLKPRCIKYLEVEWSRYKYKVLENSPMEYHAIRQLLKNKQKFPVEEFYTSIDNALRTEPTAGNIENAALHVFGYFKNLATLKEKDAFLKRLERFRQGTASIASVKKLLWELTVRYQEEYLIKSYYFNL